MVFFLMAPHLHIADIQLDRVLFLLTCIRRVCVVETHFTQPLLSYGHIYVFPC